MSLASVVNSALGSPAAGYIPSAALPAVAKMRFKGKHTRQSGTGTAINSGWLNSLDTNSETTGDKWYGSLGIDGISGKMRKNPHIVQSVGYVTNPLRAATWWFNPGKSATPLAREIADFLEFCFLERLPWDPIIKRMVGGYVQDGFAMSEMTDQIQAIPTDRFPLHPGGGRGLVPTGLHDIPQNTVSKWYKKPDEPNQLASIDQWQPFSDHEQSGYRKVMMDRVVRITVDQEGGNFAGVPILRSAYAAWVYLEKFEIYRAIGVERTSVGNPVASVVDGSDFDNDEAIDVEAALEAMRVNAKGSFVLPPGYTLTWEGAGENDLQNCQIAIESLKTDIAVNVGAGFTRLGLVGPGSYALGNTQAGQYHLSVLGHAALLCLVFNLGLDGWSPVRRIVEANYGKLAPVPRLEARNLPTRDIEKALKLVYEGVRTGVIVPDDPLEDETRTLLQIGARDPGTSRKQAKQQKFKLEPDDDAGEEEPDDDKGTAVDDE